jgi:hypothetical protein
MDQEIAVVPSTNMVAAQSSMPSTQFLPDSKLHRRLEQLDQSVTDVECRSVVSSIDAYRRAGMDAAVKTVRSIMGVYPRSDVDDPQAYALAAALVVAEYPPLVLGRISDPRVGLASRCKFLPRIAELKEACDAEVARLHKVRWNAALLISRRLPTTDRQAGLLQTVRELGRRTEWPLRS